MAYPNFYQPMYQPQMQFDKMPQIQNGGIVNVRSEMEARNYPVGLGTSLIFKDEMEPTVIYTKTMGFNQLDAPVFDKYRLVKENASEASYKPHTAISADETINSSMNEMKTEIKAIWSEIDALKKDGTRKIVGNKKKEVNADDPE